ncbi:hypothetical protein EVAR_53516_1 [Eumeta japonica]|uniref:Uncharacterized protein n=1 Tax=Eumeta variegata TaxID=151549 RepID=A0A4C1Y7Q5_EUMVA|nr:hypothetical protein EVAR_53516_1 [Eumeta japonica]
MSTPTSSTTVTAVSVVGRRSVRTGETRRSGKTTSITHLMPRAPKISPPPEKAVPRRGPARAVLANFKLRPYSGGITPFRPQRPVACFSAGYRCFEKPAPEIPTCCWMCQNGRGIRRMLIPKGWCQRIWKNAHWAWREELLTKLEVDKFGEAREVIPNVYLIETEDTEQDTSS